MEGSLDVRVVEICAGAGGQALGLELAGFEHTLAVELDKHACTTLEQNRRHWDVRLGDVADPAVWKPEEFKGIDLLAGGVPCPPFSIAGKQLGALDERDLFAWAVETVGSMKPRALMLENVRGLSEPRFSAYRQHVLERLDNFGYKAEWKLLHANEFGVPQLRPRFVLVAMKSEDMAHFHWPESAPTSRTVGEVLRPLMAAGGWPHVDDWVKLANDIGPTIVGGSKKHGGADLGPTRAKRAWAALGVDGLGVANEAPGPEHPHPSVKAPKLTVEMVALIQGWDPAWNWEFSGKKTAQYRQVGNAFPPPVARAVGTAIRKALAHEAPARTDFATQPHVHDEVYLALRAADKPLTLEQLSAALSGPIELPALERRLRHLSRDFVIVEEEAADGKTVMLGSFKAFVGQDEHARHEYMAKHRSRVS